MQDWYSSDGLRCAGVARKVFVQEDITTQQRRSWLDKYSHLYRLVVPVVIVAFHNAKGISTTELIQQPINPHVAGSIVFAFVILKFKYNIICTVVSF